MALIRMCVVPNCSQQLSWFILWIVTVYATYWTRTHPLKPTYPLKPTHPFTHAICDITVAVKKLLKI